MLLPNSSIIDSRLQKLPTTRNKSQDRPVAFKGVVDVATQALNFCDKYPMLNVSAIDAVTAIIPRTAFDAQTNGFAAFETFRRESSGLLVNCLLPGFVVLGMAKILNNTVLRDSKHIKMSSVWANQHSIETLAEYWQNAGGKNNSAKAEHFVRNIISDISGIDADKTVKYSDKHFDFKDTIKKVTDAVLDESISVKQTVREAYKNIVEQTRAAEIIKLGEKDFGSNLTALLNNTLELGRRFSLEKNSADLSSFKKNAIRLVNAKSLAGFAFIIPLAMSMQSINRWITKKTSGKKGAPIYKDFTENHKNDHDREHLTRNKFVAIAAMLGVAIASMAKMPTMSMFQFKGLFPTLDQCRWISTSTFCSRMAVSEDNNELRETFIRDTITFASLYWLGDYASKLAAKGFEKLNPNLKLINHIKPSSKDDNVFKQIGNWIKNTRLKSFDEVANTVKARNARTLSQLAGFGFSTLVLGLLLPKYTRMQTEKKEREFREKQKNANTENIKKLFRLGSVEEPKVFQKFSGLQN